MSLASHFEITRVEFEQFETDFTRVVAQMILVGFPTTFLNLAAG